MGTRLAIEFGAVWCREPDLEPDTGDLGAPPIVVPSFGNTQGNLYSHQVACQPRAWIEVTVVQVVYERCCGLDVHKDTVVACVITPEGESLCTFGTMTRDLKGLADWLAGKGVTHVAMESTGVYWNLLESFEFTLVVVNAREVKAVLGRKADVKDAEWIADLLRHGLLKAS